MVPHITKANSFGTYLLEMFLQARGIKYQSEKEYKVIVEYNYQSDIN
jgi:hypothetical protein